MISSIHNTLAIVACGTFVGELMHYLLIESANKVVKALGRLAGTYTSTYIPT